MANLPLNTRRWSYFAVTTPGAVPDGTFGDVAFRGMGYMFDTTTPWTARRTTRSLLRRGSRAARRPAYSTSMQLGVETSGLPPPITRQNMAVRWGAWSMPSPRVARTPLHGSAHFYLRDSTIGGAYTPFETGAVLQPTGSYVVRADKTTGHSRTSSARTCRRRNYQKQTVLVFQLRRAAGTIFPLSTFPSHRRIFPDGHYGDRLPQAAAPPVPTLLLPGGSSAAPEDTRWANSRLPRTLPPRRWLLQ